LLYDAYQLRDDLLAPLQALTAAGGEALRLLPGPLRESPIARLALAGAELVPFARLRHDRPSFGIDTVTVGGDRVAVRERPALITPFATLLHFDKESGSPGPRVLLVAPLSGHFATLLRATVRTMLPDHDLYVTDWHNAREVPAELGRFGLDEYIEHLISFLSVVGEGAHLVAVCQPCAPALAATALMAEDDDACLPRSLTLIAGPVDARVNPNAINRLSENHSIEWFARNMLSRVPARYAGAGRTVYPGFMQAGAFIGMNATRHASAMRELFVDVAVGNDDRAQRTKRFYEEYLSVLDMTGEFYLDTVGRIFQTHELAVGEFVWHGRLVDPAAIEDVVLLTIEGENDDISAIGQTAAAHALCSGIAAALHYSHVQPNVGHYGVFSGRNWDASVYPLIRETIRAADGGAGDR
jgi:poly(3-hydroxybutyrate) depolymerase